MRLFVTGSYGQLGTDLQRVARERGHEIAAAVDVDTLDITDLDAVRAALAASPADVLINAAAFTAVDAAEEKEELAYAVNATGPANLATACAETGTQLVHVSTDYVFDGARSPQEGAYVESDMPAPHSVYGASKLAGEEAVAGADLSFAIVRSSWLFGVGGRNFVATMLALGEERDEVTVVTDQIGCPTATAHLAPALLALARDEDAQGIFHVAGSGQCSWHELAVETFRQAGIACRVLPCTTADMPRPAPRPAFSALASERDDAPLLPPWQEGLTTYLAQRGVHA